MKEHSKIILIGMPGSGKSTLGKILAKQLNFDFYDLDEEIVKSEGMEIPKIFLTKGEGYFRRLETRVLSAILDKEDSFLLSTGGGAPCYNDNLERINQKGISVYLEVGVNELLQRLTKNEADKRPMFQGLDTPEISQKLQDLLTEREEFYQKAKIKLSGDDITTEFLVSELMTYFRN
ncbi:shikimate kinase [Echinicola shivajiensis]|uniref:shikimate kinase n=1 Tax=Echinicola shivajiensis TaxID=1035916 RepID=UPI001BFCC0E0|nr:shikimate kinase [Echinicola shivajiensis]